MVKDKSNVVLVTGATGGIGKSIVNKYSRQGLTLAIADKDEEQANKLVHEINHGNGKAMAFPGDLLDQKYCDSLANEVQKNLEALIFSSTMRVLCVVVTSHRPLMRIMIYQ